MTDEPNVDVAASKRSALFVTTLGAFLSPFGISSVNIALPSIAQEFQMDAILLSWVTTTYVLASATFPVPFGKIADIYGRKRVFTCGIVLYTLASFGSAISNSSTMLLCSRILQGIGASANYSVGAAILTSVFPSRELGKVLGINAAALYLGLSVGPFFGGFLTQYLGWRSIFLVNIVVGLIILVSVFWKLKGEWREAEKERFDLTGSVIYSVTLLLIMYGFSQLSTISGAWLILLGGLGLWGFMKWEAKVKNPIFNTDLFRNNRAFVFSNLAALISYSSTFAVTFLLSLYLQYVKAFSPETAGLILLSQPIVQAVMSPFAGKLSDRIEPQVVASIGMGLTAIGLFFLIFLTENTTLVFILACLVLLGFGFALFSSPNTNALMSSVDNRFYGVASGTLGTMRATGRMFSMGITILIFSIYIGRVQITPEYHPVFLKCVTFSFSLFAVLCFGGIFASLARGKVRKKK